MHAGRVYIIAATAPSVSSHSSQGVFHYLSWCKELQHPWMLVSSAAIGLLLHCRHSIKPLSHQNVQVFFFSFFLFLNCNQYWLVWLDHILFQKSVEPKEPKEKLNIVLFFFFFFKYRLFYSFNLNSEYITFLYLMHLRYFNSRIWTSAITGTNKFCIVETLQSGLWQQQNGLWSRPGR